MDGGCSHGALAWRHSEQRRAVLVKYQARNNNWGGGAIDPRDRWAADTIDGMDEAEFAVMRGPARYGRDNTVPRLDIDLETGEVVVSTDAGTDSYSSKVALQSDAGKKMRARF